MKKNFYIEYISFENIFFKILPHYLYKRIYFNRNVTFFYIDSTKAAKFFFNILSFIFKFKIERIDFKMLDIKDDNGDLIRMRIPFKDLFFIQEKIIKSDKIKQLKKQSWEQDNFYSFLAKELCNVSIVDCNSAGRILFIINIINWHMIKQGINESILFINCNTWRHIYTEYANKYNINCIITKRTTGIKILLKNLILRKSFLHLTYRKIKFKKLNRFFSNKKNHNNPPKISFFGRGNYSLKNNSLNSDLFFYLNSNLEKKHISVPFNSNITSTDIKNLEKSGIETSFYLNNGKVFPKYLGINSSKKHIKINKLNQYNAEYKEILNISKKYNKNRSLWSDYLNLNNTKIFLTWFKYSADHIAIFDALNEIGGTLAIWQLAYEDLPSVGTTTISDIFFSFSKNNHLIQNNQNSKIKYNVTTGYLQDYRFDLLKPAAEKIKNELQKNGAQKIISCFDENSLDDSRWHTGHELQRENYTFLLEKLLENEWLGVIFKPKTPGTLFNRMGTEVVKLIKKAEATGRCKILMSKGATSESAVPPILAGLASDISIQGHLTAGTTGMECALAGIPSLLIDREGWRKSNLWSLGEGNVIFRNWDTELWNKLTEFWYSKEAISNFGNWSPILDELDPFRDGRAAYRMGTYLKWLIEGYEHGLKKEIILADAAERYTKIWGEDKIVSS